jgi:hypothetical protein
MSEEKKKGKLHERLLSFYGNRRQEIKEPESPEREGAAAQELESMIRRVIKEELSKLPRTANDVALIAVAQAVKDIMPELQMDVRDVAEFLNPPHRRKQYLALQGDDVNRQVLVEVADLHLAISALDKTITAYDESRREDGYFLAGHVVNAVREEFDAEREKIQEAMIEAGKTAQENKATASNPKRSNIVIPLLTVTAANFLLTLVLLLLLLLR